MLIPFICVCAKLLQLCPALFDPMDCTTAVQKSPSFYMLEPNFSLCIAI